MPGFVDRVADQARTARPLKAFLTLLALPFYVLGWVVGLLWVVGTYAVFAVKVGVLDARAKSRPVKAVKVEPVEAG